MRKDCKTLLWATLTLPLVAGCDLIEYHPYDTRVEGATHINARNIQRIEESCRGQKTLKFAFISDTQRWYDETEAAVRAINRRTDVDFVIHGGDQSDFGVTKEFMWMRDILNGLKVPYVCLIGNHDCLGTGEDVFRTIYGDPNFAFTAGDVRFICLNTNALEYDYSEPVPDFTFMEQERDSFPAEATRTLFAMHVKPTDEQFNNNVAKVFQAYIHTFPSPLCCIYGHGHNMRADDLFGDGLMYYEVTCIKDRQYLLFTIHEEGYEYEEISF